MYAVTTKYQGPSEVKGSRIIATGGFDKKRLVVAYDDALSSWANHEAAALAWLHIHMPRFAGDRWQSGELPDGSIVHVKVFDV